MLVKLDWIEDIKDFFLKHYVDIMALAMLWRYGLGHRPANIGDNILTVGDLPPLDVLLTSERNDVGLKASKAAQKVGDG